MACKSVERFKQGTQNVRDDRQTDHAMEKWLAIGKIAGARVILPDDTDNKISNSQIPFAQYILSSYVNPTKYVSK